MIDKHMINKINLFVLLAGIILIIVLCPHEKKLFYDEPYQIMCSKGITRANIDKFTALSSFSSADLDKENTVNNVFLFGGDSIHYVLLHYLTMIAGNDLNTYVYFSLFWGILAFIAFYFLSKIILGDNIFISFALILLFTNFLFLVQTYSIRHYIMAMFWIIVASIYFFRYMFEKKNNKNLLLLGLFCAISFISHYFTAYIILIFGLAILTEEKMSLFKVRKILALAIPLALLLIYYRFHTTPMGGLSYYNDYVGNTSAVSSPENNLPSFLTLFLKSVAVNFQVLFSLFKDILIVRIGSFILVIAAYVYGLTQVTRDNDERKKYNLLFAFGTVSCLFLTVLAIYTKNHLLFSYRYFLFSVPYCSLFLALLIKNLFRNKTNVILKVSLLTLLLSTGLIKFVMLSATRGKDNPLACNHTLVIQKIIKNNIHKIEVPDAVDAVFINSLLPANSDITYILRPNTSNAVLYYQGSTEQIPLINNALIVTF